MTFAPYAPIVCGETNDKEIEQCSVVQGLSAAAIAVVADPFSGTYAVEYDLQTAGARALTPCTKGGEGIHDPGNGIGLNYRGIVALTGAGKLTGTFTSEACLLYGTTGSIGVPLRGTGRRYVRIGTDGKLRFYTRNGTQVGTASSTQLTSAAYTEFAIFIDSISLPTVFIWLFINGVEELAFDTGVTPANFWEPLEQLYWGEYLAAGVSRGAKLRLDDCIARYSAETISDAPYSVQYPRLRVAALSMATADLAEGDVSDWTSTTAGPNSHQDVDDTELPDNDGDTSHWQSTTNSQKHLVLLNGANPLPNPCTVDVVMAGVAHRLTGAGKAYAFQLYKRGGAESANSYGQTSPTEVTVGLYHGNWFYDFNSRPGGGAWQRSDFDAGVLQAGRQSFSTNAGERTSYFRVCPVYYTALLPLASQPGFETPREVRGARARVARIPGYDPILRARPDGAGLAGSIEGAERALEGAVRAERELVPA